MFPVRVRPWDASAGGISFICPRENAVMGLKPDAKVQLLLNYRGRTVRAAGTVRFNRFITERVIKTGVALIPSSMEDADRQNFSIFLGEIVPDHSDNVRLRKETGGQ